MNGQQVGQQFVRVYFKTFFNDPKSLLSLYKEESTFTRGEGKDVVTYKGLKVCARFPLVPGLFPSPLLHVLTYFGYYFHSLLVMSSSAIVGDRDCLGRSSSELFGGCPQRGHPGFFRELYCDCTYFSFIYPAYLTPLDRHLQDRAGIHFPQVTGLFRDTVADSRRAFTQVFLLHPQKPKGLFVLNEVFLYADHEEDDADEERDGEPGDPQDLRHRERHLQRGLAARARLQRLGDDAPSMPSG